MKRCTCAIPFAEKYCILSQCRAFASARSIIVKYLSVLFMQISLFARMQTVWHKKENIPSLHLKTHLIVMPGKHHPKNTHTHTHLEIFSSEIDTKTKDPLFYNLHLSGLCLAKLNIWCQVYHKNIQTNSCETQVPPKGHRVCVLYLCATAWIWFCKYSEHRPSQTKGAVCQFQRRQFLLPTMWGPKN